MMNNGSGIGGGGIQGPNLSGGNDPTRAAALNMLQRGGAATAPAGVSPGGPGAGASPGSPGSIGSSLARTTAEITDYVNMNGWTQQDSDAVLQFIETLKGLAAPFMEQGGGGQGMPSMSAPQGPPSGPGTGMLPAGNMMAQGATNFRGIR